MMRSDVRSKIEDQSYVRLTRTFFFSKQQLELFEQFNFSPETICYLERDTVNQASKNKCSRIFVQ